MIPAVTSAHIKALETLLDVTQPDGIAPDDEVTTWEKVDDLKGILKWPLAVVVLHGVPTEVLEKELRFRRSR